MTTDGAIAEHVDALSLDDEHVPELNVLAAHVSEWHARELPDAPRHLRVGKLVEEAAEVLGATIKLEEQEAGHRPAADDWLERARLEVADTIIAAIGAAEALGVVDVDELVRRRFFDDVARRRFRTASR